MAFDFCARVVGIGNRHLSAFFIFVFTQVSLKHALNSLIVVRYGTAVNKLRFRIVLNWFKSGIL